RERVAAARAPVSARLRQDRAQRDQRRAASVGGLSRAARARGTRAPPRRAAPNGAASLARQPRRPRPRRRGRGRQSSRQTLTAGFANRPETSYRSPMVESAPHKPVTAPDIVARQRDGVPLVMITAYDATFARLIDACDVDIVLVGDSLGMVMQGHEHTLEVTVDDMIYHARCVRRGLRRAHLTVDMPFMSYQVSPDVAVH